MATLGPTVDTYIRRRGKETRYWAELKDRFDKHLIPGLGGRERILTTITKADIRKLINTKLDEGYPVAARTCYESLSPFFKHCLNEDHILFNPMQYLAPPKPCKQRDRVLSAGEQKAVWNACKQMQYWGAFFQLCMLTCQRRDSVAGMQYYEIHDKIWCIPAGRMKDAKSHIVHLSDAACTIIACKPEFIGMHASGFSKAKHALDKLSGVHNWRIHDLRRTGATVMQELGIVPDVIELILAHAIPGVKGIYQRYEYLPQRREALELLGTHYECL
jgi:integrase